MADQGRRLRLGRLGHDLVLRTVVYYVLLAAILLLVWRVLPPRERSAAAQMLAGFGHGGGDIQLGPSGLRGAAAADPVPGHAALAAAVAISAAFLLVLPVSWVYMVTHQRKGYQQTLVHTLVLLPVVVAGIVVVVQNSLALAFSLAGIVAAVRFRSTMDDSRDLVYIFLALGLGLSAGFQLEVAVVLSVMFNAVMLAVWYSDFGRAPPGLEGVRARRQMERALATASRTGTFVARLDKEVLQELAPAQLDALAERIRLRREESAPGAPVRKRLDARLRVLAADVEGARRAIEPVLDEYLKQWHFGGVRADDDGAHVLEYEARLRKSVSPQDVLDAVRARGAPHVVGVELE